MSVSIRPADRADAASIAHIETTGPTPSWTQAEVGATLDLPTTIAIVAVAERGDVVGHLVSAVVLDEAEVLIIAVAPSVRRRGIGRTLLAEAERRWAAQGVARAFLDVRADNTPALGLYRSAGWRTAGQRRAYYRDGTTAIVLERTLSEGGTAPSS